MRRFIAKAALAAGAAALALTMTSPVVAGPGGKGGGGGGGEAHGGGGGKHEGGGGPGSPGGGGGHGDHGNGGGMRGGGSPWAGGGEGRGRGHGGGPQFGGGGHGGGRGGERGPRMHEAQRHERGPARQHGWAERHAGVRGHTAQGGRWAHDQQSRGGAGKHGPGAMRAAAVGAGVVAGAAAFHGAAERGGRAPGGQFAVPADNGGQARVSFRGERPTFLGGCPPGLAKKYNGCNPPGLVRSSAVPWQPDWWGYPDSGYRYFDGYLLRTSGPAVLGYVPLLGGPLFIGEIWPAAYETAPAPAYYSDYYDLGPDYRYYDDTFYRLEPRTNRIVGVAGFLTGDEFVVGEPMPVGYDVYNVPWDYRGRYADGPDAWYRYADGYVYRIDPKTMLILAAIQLLT